MIDTHTLTPPALSLSLCLCLSRCFLNHLHQQKQQGRWDKLLDQQNTPTIRNQTLWLQIKSQPMVRRQEQEETKE
jgi:hypothetical protein